MELLIIVEEFPGFPKPDLIMIMGGAAYTEFIGHLKSAMLENMGRVPDILSYEPVVVAAKGTNEFMWRGPAPWSRPLRRTRVTELLCWRVTCEYSTYIVFGFPG